MNANQQSSTRGVGLFHHNATKGNTPPWMSRFLDADKYLGGATNRKNSVIVPDLIASWCCSRSSQTPGLRASRRTRRKSSTAFNNVVINYSPETNIGLTEPLNDTQRAESWLRAAGLNSLAESNAACEGGKQEDSIHRTITGDGSLAPGAHANPGPAATGTVDVDLAKYFGSPIDVRDHCLTPQGLVVANEILQSLQNNDWCLSGPGRYSLPTETRDYCPMVPDLLCFFLAFVDNPQNAERLLVRLLERSSCSPSNSVAGPSLFLPLSRPTMALYHVILDDMVRTHVPGVVASLEKVGLRASDVAKELCWFSRLFLGTLPYTAAIKVVDVFVADGSKVLFRVASAVFLVLEHRIKEWVAAASPVPKSEFASKLAAAVASYPLNHLLDCAAGIAISREAIASYATKHVLCMTTLCRYRPNDNKDARQYEGDPKHLLWHPSETEWIGFDLDHTLVVYNESEVSKLMYTAVVEYLHNKKSPLEDIYAKLNLDDSFLTNLANVGMEIDVSRGNLVKFGHKGTISVLFHGTTLATPIETAFLSKEDDYKVASLENEEKAGKAKVFVMVHTHFEYMIGPLFAKIVDLIDEKVKTEQEGASQGARWHLNATVQHERCKELYARCFADLKSAFMFAQSHHCQDGLDANLVQNTKRLVHKQPKVKKWLQNIKLASASTKTFLLTNGSYDHTELLMNYAYGSGWEALFDLIVVEASKNKFFDHTRTGQKPFSRVVCNDGVRHDQIVQVSEMERGKIYAGGCCSLLNEYFATSSALGRQSVMYFGDHMHQDVISPVRHGWQTGAIVAELAMFTRSIRKKKSHFVLLNNKGDADSPRLSQEGEKAGTIRDIYLSVAKTSTLPHERTDHHPLMSISSPSANGSVEYGFPKEEDTSGFNEHTVNFQYLYMSHNTSFGNPFLSEVVGGPSLFASRVAAHARVCVPSLRYLARLDPSKASTSTTHDMAVMYGLALNLKSVLSHVTKSEMTDTICDYYDFEDVCAKS